MSEFIPEDEMRERIRQALLDHDDETLRTEWNNLLDNHDDDYPYNFYELLCETLNELFEELPDDEYLAALNAAPWWHEGQFVQFGLEDDRKLFEVVKQVVNAWDPERLIDKNGFPDDEYSMEIGKISKMLKSAKDIDEISWGVYDVLSKCFDYGEPRWKSVFPEYTIVAGKLMAAVQASGLEGFGPFVEKPYTIAELVELEQRLTEFIKEIGQNLAATETPEKMNEYLNKLHESLKGEHNSLSGDDINSLYVYCASEAIRYLWRNGDKAFKESRLREIKELLREQWKYEPKRPRLPYELPANGIWRRYTAWEGLSKKDKLNLGKIISVELEYLNREEP